ncbi:glycoside hydrolase family 15 protein [Streptomyces coffeae]|uniref:Glycoside hydrolase family 15 protein n=1 Tax=Streptomyces coffeae TaxID=621382 RepID=A0ABS1NFC1_9ACTN|nr:glycoside hydrolase family 15 protein [Streptomyces coffeae]MBL1098639.1 glycoside hydrolase family 15 protein [Streptomyces coffeae]
MDTYPNISDHGLIGDLQTAALVATDGTIDWFCGPRFDSPSIFAALLDQRRGGHFRVSPGRADYITKQLYLPDTAILITRFMTPDGVGEVYDFMPVTPGPATDRHRLVRLIRVVRGRMRFDLDCRPRPGYGRERHRLEIHDEGAVFHGDTVDITLHPAGERISEHAEIHATEGGIRSTLDLAAGQAAGVVLDTAEAGHAVAPRRVPEEEILRMLDTTTRFWRRWTRGSRYTGRWRETVARSAITLKLMTYAPTGALVAAPTAALPEQIGGERNWDYRYTWIRDASFSVYALLGLGFTAEAEAFATWLRDRVVEQAGDGSGPLKIMYRVHGSSDLVEETLDHFEGYRGSAPVRIGNGAADQLQLDIYGEMMDSLFHADTHGITIGHRGWSEMSRVVDWLCDHWDRSEEGIWETRGGRQDFTYGRMMSWVALDRAVRLAESRGRPSHQSLWRITRDSVYQQVMDRGWSRDRKAFVQHYGSPVLDASLLLMPLIGFVEPRDPMWLSTLDAMDQELVSDSLVYRYDPAASPDGLKGSEGTFSMCTFWYVDALARSGRLEYARLTFEKMLTYANHLGLFSEEIGLTGEQLGNFPQAFSHLALVNAAVNLDYQLDHGSGWVGPVLGLSTA